MNYKLTTAGKRFSTVGTWVGLLSWSRMSDDWKCIERREICNKNSPVWTLEWSRRRSFTANPFPQSCERKMYNCAQKISLCRFYSPGICKASPLCALSCAQPVTQPAGLTVMVVSNVLLKQTNLHKFLSTNTTLIRFVSCVFSRVLLHIIFAWGFCFDI